MQRKRLKYCALVATLCLSTAIQAHPTWFLPNDFTVSSEADKGEWVTLDASASHTMFGFDKALSLDQVKIYSPDARENRLRSYFRGQRRSVFDVLLDQEGTYKILRAQPPFYFTKYKIGSRDTMKLKRGSKLEVQHQLPSGARDVTSTRVDHQTMTFLTNNAPSDEVLAISGKGFEIDFNVHPNDIVSGEEVVLTMLLAGEAVAGSKIELTPGGTKYRDSRGAVEQVTESDGRVVFTPRQAGPWLLAVVHESKVEQADADYVRYVRYLTFEVMAE